MSLEVSFAVLLAALLHASWNAMIKGGRDVLIDTASIVAGAGLVAAPFLFLVPLPAAASWPYIMASIATHLAYYFFMVNAYRSGDLSLVYPLMRGVAPLITGLLGIDLAARTAGGDQLGRDAADFTGRHRTCNASARPDYRPGRPWPSRRFRACQCGRDRHLHLDRRHRARASLATLGPTSSGSSCWMRYPFSVYMLATRRMAFIDASRERRRAGLIGGGLSAAAYAISVWAMTKAPVALVASLRETSVLFATLIGARLLNENLTPRRWAGVAAVVAGVVAVKGA